MRLSYFVSTAVLAILSLGVQSASALSVDDKSMNGSNASSFDDPDDKTPTSLFQPLAAPSYLQGGKEGSFNGSVDPSSVRYDYDPSSGNYVAHTGR